jgi:predicted transcriptional regulator
MAQAVARRVALLSIQPRYAAAIFDGQKKVEFRKTKFRILPDLILVYASAPVQRVIGWFEPLGVRELPPDELWARFGPVGCIEAEAFERYYDEIEVGIAIEVGNHWRLREPLMLSAIVGDSPPPQNFQYVSEEVVDRLQEHLNIGVNTISRIATKRSRRPPRIPYASG